jgi:hypothetical protein
MTTLEKIETSIKFSDAKTMKILKKNSKIIAEILENKIEGKNHQFYIDFLFGYLKKKPKALKEDIEHAVDLAIFYKSKPERFDFRILKPNMIGENYEQISEVHREYLKNQSKNEIQKAKHRGELIDGVTVDVKYKDEMYTVYLVAALKDKYTPHELDIQHLKYCHLGKDTSWCTAHPEGSYYQNYATHDIYVIHKNNKPYLQFNVVKNKIDQFMDVNDSEVQVANQRLINIIQGLFS